MRAAQLGAVAHATAGVRRLLEQPLQLAAGHAVGTGRVERATHLAGDLVFADDHRLEPAGDGEQVGCDIRPLMHRDGRTQQVDGNIGCRGHRLDDRLDRDRLAAGERLVDVEIGLEPIARREHDGAGHEQLVIHEGARRRGGAHRETLQDVEARVPMVRGQTEKHDSNLNVCLCMTLTLPFFRETIRPR